MRLRWTNPAADDLYNIVRHVQRDNPDAAADVAESLYDGCGNLRKFPHLGRKGRIEGTRELVFSSLPYIVVYRIQDQIVEIMRIYHGAQDWP
jgi:addiction module RelE/StbE family toxin